jgi:hypothetical protein
MYMMSTSDPWWSTVLQNMMVYSRRDNLQYFRICWSTVPQDMMVHSTPEHDCLLQNKMIYNTPGHDSPQLWWLDTKAWCSAIWLWLSPYLQDRWPTLLHDVCSKAWWSTILYDCLLFSRTWFSTVLQGKIVYSIAMVYSRTWCLLQGMAIHYRILLSTVQKEIMAYSWTWWCTPNV